VIRRSSRLLLEVLAAVLAGFFVLGGIAVWRLSQEEPVRLTFLTPYLVDALTPADGSFRVTIADTVLSWGGWERTLDLRATGVRMQDAGGRTIAAIPALSLTLSARALALHRMVAPTAIEVFGPRLFIVREADGHFRFVQAAPDDPARASDEASPVAARFLEALLSPPDPSLPAGYLTRATITDGQLTFIDRTTGVSWHAPAANIALARDARGISGRLDLEVERLGNPARLDAAVAYDSGTRMVTFTADMAGVQASALAAIDPVLSRFAGADITLDGKLTSTMDLDGRIGRTTFDLAGGAGTLTMPDVFESPLPISSLALAASYDPAPDRLTLARASIQFEGPRLTMAGTVDGVHAGTGAGTAADMRIVAKLTAENVALGELSRYWPLEVKPNPRNWIAAHIPDGTADRVEADIGLTMPAGDPDATLIDRFEGTIAGSGLTVHYLDPLPPVEGADGTAHFTHRTFDIDFTSGHVQGIEIDSGTLRISGLDEPDQIIDIEGHLRGPLAETLRILDHPPLGYAGKLGIAPDNVAGRATATLGFRFPAEKDLAFDQVEVTASAELADATVKQAMLGQDLSDGAAKLELDRAGMTLAGTGKFGAAPIEFRWEENFGAGKFTRRVAASGRFDAAQRAAMGYDYRPYVDGPVDAAVTYTRLPKDRATVELKLKLAEATLEIPTVAWKKPAGTPGDAYVALDLSGERVRAIPDFSVVAGDLSATGAARFDDKGGLGGVDLTELRLGRTDLRGVQVAFAGRRADIVIAGGEIDAQPIIKGSDATADDSTPSFTLRAARLNRVHLGENRSLDNVSVSLRHDGQYWEEIVLDATLPEAAPLSVRYEPVGGRHRLSVASPDAGATLRAFDIMETVKGGTLSITGEADDAAPGRPLVGQAEIVDFRVVRASVLARLLTLATLTGFVDVLTGEGFQFNRFESDFTKTDGRLDIKLARAHGPSIGLTGTGFIDFDRQAVDVEGTIVPAYALNSIVNDIPVIGFILSGGEGEGMFAATYHATGPLEEPKISVNPLAALAPGFLRGLFNIFDSEGGAPPPPTALPGSSK
jgi:uncharacterized protein YhdP